MTTLTDEEIAAVKDFWLHAGDVDGNAEEALACAKHGNRSGCIERLEWARQNIVYAQQHLATALNKIRT